MMSSKHHVTPRRPVTKNVTTSAAAATANVINKPYENGLAPLDTNPPEKELVTDATHFDANRATNLVGFNHGY